MHRAGAEDARTPRSAAARRDAADGARRAFIVFALQRAIGPWTVAIFRSVLRRDVREPRRWRPCVRPMRPPCEIGQQRVPSLQTRATTRLASGGRWRETTIWMQALTNSWFKLSWVFHADHKTVKGRALLIAPKRCRSCPTSGSARSELPTTRPPTCSQKRVGVEERGGGFKREEEGLEGPRSDKSQSRYVLKHVALLALSFWLDNRTALQIVVQHYQKKFVRSDDSSNNFHLPRRV